MTSLILQPSGNQFGRAHYVDTIENPVALSKCKTDLSLEIFMELEKVHPSGFAAMWGVTPGASFVNRNKWERIQIGDVALFARDGGIKATAVVASKFHSKALAKNSWGVDADGFTWEYMYSLDEVRTVDISYLEFNRIVGYKENYVIQGFNVLDPERSTLFLDRYKLWSERHVPTVPEEQFAQALSGLDGELDQKVQGWRRVEQSKARNRLLRGLTLGECFFCGRQMSAEFLIAAHIKRRSDCNDFEKRDIDNNMMLACRFGCDDLFEKGYITINSFGEITMSPKLMDATALAYTQLLVNKQIKISIAGAVYFKWHQENRFLS